MYGDIGLLRSRSHGKTCHCHRTQPGCRKTGFHDAAGAQRRDLPAVCREAEVLVATAGRAELVRKEFLSPGQIVIDVGINADDDGNLFGDVAFGEAEEIVSAITPVPGGVGSVTTAVLAKHVIMTAEKMAGMTR